MLPVEAAISARTIPDFTIMILGFGPSLHPAMTMDHFRAVLNPPFVDAFTLYALSGLLFLAAILFFVSPHRRTITPSDSLKALLHVITPCSSSWPSHYMSLAKPRQSKTFQVPLDLIIQDIISGQIELRTPQNTLQQMMSRSGQLQIEAWQLFFSYGSLRPKILYRSCLWSIFPGKYLPLRLLPNPEYIQASTLSSSRSDTAESISLRQTSNSVVSCRQNAPDDPSYSISEAVFVLPALLPTLAPHILRKIAVATTLDTTPHAHLETALLELQASIPTGLLALLEFTTCEAAPSVWSTPWLLSALPFIYPVSNTSYVSSKCHRLVSVSPLRNRLPSIITLLESGTRSCTILSIQNVSTQHAQLLDDYACKVEGKLGRERFLTDSGDSESALCAWRAEMFWARWEAACYACGDLTRWVICMKRPTG